MLAGRRSTWCSSRASLGRVDVERRKSAKIAELPASSAVHRHGDFLTVGINARPRPSASIDGTSIFLGTDHPDGHLPPVLIVGASTFLSADRRRLHLPQLGSSARLSSSTRIEGACIFLGTDHPDGHLPPVLIIGASTFLSADRRRLHLPQLGSSARLSSSARTEGAAIFRGTDQLHAHFAPVLIIGASTFLSADRRRLHLPHLG
jgi:hypothetical protein